MSLFIMENIRIILRHCAIILHLMGLLDDHLGIVKYVKPWRDRSTQELGVGNSPRCNEKYNFFTRHGILARHRWYFGLGKYI